MNWQLRRELLTNVAAIMGGGLQAALNLDFTTLTPATMATAGVTFSRASNATKYDSTGKLTFAPNNELTQSQTFDHADWLKSGLTGVTANATTAPDGTVTADALVEDNATSDHRIRSASITYDQSNELISVYAKPGTRSWLALGDGTGVAWFNVTSGSVGTVQAGVANATITASSNGFYLCSVRASARSGSDRIVIYIADADNSTNYTGSSAGTALYVWGAQAERVTYETTPRTYNVTVASAYYGPRFDYNPSTLAAKGLLIEEARTNLATYSVGNGANWATLGGGSSVAANSGTAPDGTNTATLFTAGTAAFKWLVRQNYTTTAGQPYAGTCYFKKVNHSYIFVRFGGLTAAVGTVMATVNLDTLATAFNGVTGIAINVTSINNGWIRVEYQCASATADTVIDVGVAPAGGDVSTSPAGTEQVLYWGVGLENAVFATSHIPTTSASATRAKDSASMTGASFSNWFNASEGTFLVNASRDNGENGHVMMMAGDGSFNNYVRISFSSSLYSYTDIFSGGGSVASPNSGAGTFQLNTFTKTAVAYKVNDFSIVAAGGTPGTDASGAVPVAPDRLFIGATHFDDTQWDGWIKSLTYYNTRISDSQMQSLTT